eukprot:6203213-Pleurochrysis_carterae.AAC.1
MVRERARARGQGAPTGWLRVGGAPASGARALPEYACNANKNWATVHASDEMNVRDDHCENCTAREGQNGHIRISRSKR